MNSDTTLNHYVKTLNRALDAFDRTAIHQVVDELDQAFSTGNTIYVFGNGASASLASHMACDLSKGTRIDLAQGVNTVPGPRLRVIALTDAIAVLTALGNDLTYEDVFLEQLKTLLRPGDVAFGISGSGGSSNVLRALEYAGKVGARRVAFTGAQPKAELIRKVSDVCVIAPAHAIEQIEDLHVVFFHLLVVLVRERLVARRAVSAAK